MRDSLISNGRQFPAVRRVHCEGHQANRFELVPWLLQQKFVSGPKSSSRNARTDEPRQERLNYTMECLCVHVFFCVCLVFEGRSFSALGKAVNSVSMPQSF